MILITYDTCCHTEGYFECEVTELYDLHWLTHQSGAAKHLPAPCKYGIALQVEFCHNVAIGIYIVLATAGHQFLNGF